MQTDVFHCIYIWQIWFVFMKPFETGFKCDFFFTSVWSIGFDLWSLNCQLRFCVWQVFVKIFSEVFVNLLSKVFLMWNQWTIFAPIFVIHLNTFWERFSLDSLPLYLFAYSSFSKTESSLFEKEIVEWLKSTLFSKVEARKLLKRRIGLVQPSNEARHANLKQKNTFFFILGRLDD